MSCNCVAALEKGTTINCELTPCCKTNDKLSYDHTVRYSTLACHVKGSSEIPVIHGKDAAYIINALLEYQNKTRTNETMRSVAGALGKDEMAALAAYFYSNP